MKLPSNSLSELLEISVLVRIPLGADPETRTSGKYRGGMKGHCGGVGEWAKEGQGAKEGCIIKAAATVGDRQLIRIISPKTWRS